MLAVSADCSKTVPKQQSLSRCQTKDWMKINL